MQRLVTLCGILLLSATGYVSAAAAEPAPAEQLAAVMEAWRNGQLSEASSQLTEMIDAGTLDARAYYYRAIISEHLGGDADADLKTAARLEAETSSTRLINRSLENVQGPIRVRIEKFRADARAQLKPDPAAEAFKTQLREGMEARRQGDLPGALEKFDAAIADGSTDPRVYYLRGVVLAAMGQLDDAKSAFANGLAQEKTSDDVDRVNRALSDVQGGVRQLIEEETHADFNGRMVSRKEMAQIVRRLDSMTQEERLAAAEADEALKAQRAQAAAEERQKNAAAAIVAEKQAKMAAEAQLNTPGATTELLATTETPKKPEPPKAAVTPVAEAPAPTSSNPFLGGTVAGVGTRASSGPIDMSYLPEDLDFLTYARPADILASGFIQPLKSMPEFEQAMQQAAEVAGFEVADIESVTSGMGNSMAGITQMVLMASTQGTAQGMPNPMTPANSLSVIRTNKDIDIAKLIEIGKGVASTHDGKTYYLVETPSDEQPQLAVYPVDARTYVVGVEMKIQAAISDGPGEAVNDQFAFVSSGSHVVLAFSSPLLAGMSGGIPNPPPGAAPPFVDSLVKAVKGKISGAAITIDMANNLDLKVVINLTEPSAATEAKGSLDQALGMAKQAYPQMGAAMVPPPLQPSVNQMVNSLAATINGSVATVSVRVPGQIVSIIKDDPSILAGALQMGPGGPPTGLGGPGGLGGPPAGQPGRPPGFGPPGTPGPPGGFGPPRPPGAPN